MLLPSLGACAWLLATVPSLVTGQTNRDDVKGIPLRTHSLQLPYLDSDMQSRWFDFGGDTIIRADQYIRLVSDRPSQSGWIFSKVPLTASNWEIEFEFKITSESSLFGDGFAMWLTKQRGQQGQVFGSTDNFEGLGIFFDTYKNNRPGVTFPYVMAMLGDGKTSYDKGNDGKANELAGCSARGIRDADVPTKAKITYFQEESLTVELQYKEEDKWEKCFEVKDVKIPSVSYLGFSAETGELSENHDLIWVETRNLYTKPGGSGKGKGKSNAASGKQSTGKSGQALNQSSGGWGWFFLKMIFFIVLCGGAYVGFTVYRTQRRTSRF